MLCIVLRTVLDLPPRPSKFHSKGYLTMALVIMEEEQASLDELRLVVCDLDVDEGTLVRFLRAREGNARRAEDMLRRTVQWREANDVDGVRKWTPPPTILTDLRMSYTGLDEEGHPVFLIPLGKWDGRKMLGKGLKEEVVRFMHKTLEVIMDRCAHHAVSRFNLILDMDGLSLWKVAHWDSVETVLRVIKDFEANYPETLTAAYLINTPSVFWQAFKFVKPVLAGNTLKKIHILDSDQANWGPMFHNIPKHSLPPQCGGHAPLSDIHP